MKKLVFAFTTSILLASCSQSAPTEQMALDNLNKTIKPDQQGLTEYKDLKKISGIESNVNGTKTYQMTYSVNLVAKQDIHSFYMLGFIADTSKTYLDAKAKDNPMLLKDNFKKGSVINTANSSMTFVKHENGWSTDIAM